MSWLDELEEEVGRRRAQEMAAWPMPAHFMRIVDTVPETAALVRSLLEQMNERLLAGHGSVWDTYGSRDVHIWELWWGPTRDSGHYLVATLLQDSRGTLYMKVHHRRIAVDDVRFEHRLQRALRVAFLDPSLYQPRMRLSGGREDRPRRAPTATARARNGVSGLLTAGSDGYRSDGSAESHARGGAPREKRQRRRTG